ncbi:MAG: ATP-binding protein [Bacilli bacterium]
MENIIGFLLINIYAFLLIFSTTIIFFSKQRLKEFEDETYKYFLITNIFMSLSGLVLGLAVTPEFNFSNLVIVLLNKLYLVCLMVWITILTFYYLYITLKDKINKKRYKKIFTIIALVSILLISILPLDVDVTEKGAIATGASIMFTYLMFGLGFLLQIACVLRNYKNLNNKKYIPLYLLIFLGAIVLISMMVNPSLNYLINPVFIFIAFIMYHTIENPDMQMIETLLRNRELVEETVNDKSNFLFKISQEMKKPVKNIIDNSRLLKATDDLKEKEHLLEIIERDANNAYFIINDIASVSSVDFKKIKIKDGSYLTQKLFKDIESNVNNRLLNSNKDKDINFSFKTYNSYPEKLNGDYIKLKQVLLSVIYNSIKYTQKGFIDLEVDAITRYDVCRMIFTIKDSGCGMSISKVNQLLSSNADADVNDFENNDTLELQIPYIIKIIRMLGGSISIKSEEGKGTIFVIVIDQQIVSDASTNSLKDAKKYTKNVKSKKRFLIADDTPYLEKMEKLVSKYNVDVITTLVGRDVLDKINSGDNYDLIILRDNMKPDSAFNILKSLKENKKFNIPVVIVIEKNKEFIKEHFIEDGFSDCIILENIESDIKRICDKYV